MTAVVHVADAAHGRDPTGTAGLRRAFRAAAKLRLSRLRAQMRVAVMEQDVLGFGGHAPGAMPYQSGAVRMRAFDGWMHAAAGQVLGGPWLSWWVAKAWASGEHAGVRQVGQGSPPGDGSGALHELAQAELRGIAAALVQAVVREAARSAARARPQRQKVWRRLARAFDKVGPPRLSALANTITVMGHNHGKLAAYRAGGFTRVGVIPEYQQKAHRHARPTLGDAEVLTPAGEYIEDPEFEAGVRTAGDEKVCPECWEFAASSPHFIDEVEEALPLHPNCRCTWFPWDDERYAHDAWSEEAREAARRARKKSDPDGGKYFRENYWKAGRVGGYSVPTPEQAARYIRAYEEEGKRIARFARKPTGPHDAAPFQEEEHPRQRGKWVEKGGKESPYERWARLHPKHPGAGYSPTAWQDERGVIHTSSVYDAQRALFEDRKVELKQLKQVSTLIRRLGETAAEMAEAGETAPVFNLCNVSVEGTNLFCAEHLGIPRVEMPVIAAKRTKEFVAHLRSLGYKTAKDTVRADHLRATQDEIDGAKVARSMARIEDEGFYKRLVVSKDDYILDGHHTWAGQLGVDARDGTLKDDVHVKVTRVDISITKLIEEAEAWTGGAGKKAAGQDAQLSLDIDPPPFVEAEHPRQMGKFTFKSNKKAKPAAGGAFEKKELGQHKHFKASENAAEHVARVKALVAKQALRNHTYRWQVNKYIEEAKGFAEAYPQIVADLAKGVGLLKAKIGESFWREGVAMLAKGKDPLKAKQLIAKGATFGYQATEPLPKPPEPQPAPAKAAVLPVAKPEWKKVGAQKGSVSGGFYTTPASDLQWYVKTPKTEEHVNADLLANRLYKLAGVAVADEVKTELDGKPAVASKVIPFTNTLAGLSAADKSVAFAELAEGFAVDVWLGNRDVIGQGFDNVLVAGGKVTRIDQGGALQFRAQGETKPFGPVPGEISSMRDPGINPQTAKVFGGMTDDEVAASIDKVLSVSEAQIMAECTAHGLPGLAATLIARQQHLASFKAGLKGAATPETPPAHVTAAVEEHIAAEEQFAAEQLPPIVPMPAVGKATAAELEKAKKTGNFYPAPTSEVGKAAVKAFNAKWAAKVPEAGELEQKVAEYKMTKAALQAVEMQEQAAVNAQAAEVQAKAKAEAAAAKAKEQAEASGHKAKLAEIAAELGIGADDADAVDALISIAGEKPSKIIAEFKQYEASGQTKGLPISPFEYAVLRSYVGSGYVTVNEQMRKGVWTTRTHVYVNAVNRALAHMQPYDKPIKRGLKNLTKSQQAIYEPGKIVFWNALASCGKTGSFGGSTQFTINPLPGSKTRARDLDGLNEHETGGEVLIMARSSFKVTKVDGAPGGQMHVWMDEVENI